jgi:serine/threonine-protein kinase
MHGPLAEATLGDYEILAELGRGGMATVYLAHDLSLDRRVAIKLMSPQLLAVDGMAERFLLEARTAAALTHPHIIPIYAVRRTGGLLYFVMKYVAGRSLDAVLAESGPFSVPMVRAVLTQVGAALEAAHRRGVVHRDIKPANILIDEYGDAVVADFGIARVAEQRGVTQIGQTVGTPEYMSPEQCGGEELGGAADQYSLGVVAYELLTGAPPFIGESLMRIVWRMVNEKIVPLESHRPDCVGTMAATVHRMLAPQAGARWPSVADAISAMPPLALGPDDPVRAALVALAGVRPDAPRARATPVSPVVPRRIDAAPTEVAPALRVAASIRLPATAGTMTIGDEVVLAPEVRAADGMTGVEGAAIAWASSDSAVARVSAAGLLVATGIGSASIRAGCGNALATLALTVTRAGVRELALTPRQAALEVGDTLALCVTTGEAAGLLPNARLVSWTSSHPEVASVDGLGRVTAWAQGGADITAMTGGARSTVSLRVSPAVVAAVNVSPPAQRLAIGDRLRFAATPANPRGQSLPGFAVRWEVSDAAIAAISPDGVLTALRSGQVLVSARVAGRIGLAKVSVSAAPFAPARHSRNT